MRQIKSFELQLLHPFVQDFDISFAVTVASKRSLERLPLQSVDNFKGHPRIATSVRPRMSEGVEIDFVAFDADGFQEARKMLSEAVG